MTKKVRSKVEAAATAAGGEDDNEAKSRAAKRREEKAAKRAEMAAKKAEARRLAEEEKKELERSTARKTKVTQEELRRRIEEEYAALQRRVEEEKKRQSRTTDEKEYLRIVTVRNTNRDYSFIDARTVEDTIAAMMAVVDITSERRLVKTSFKSFEEAGVQRLKEEKPGLTLAQYRDMVWKLWKKSQPNHTCSLHHFNFTTSSTNCWTN